METRETPACLYKWGGRNQKQPVKEGVVRKSEGKRAKRGDLQRDQGEEIPESGGGKRDCQ